MIGMNQIKKRLFRGIAIGLAIGLVGMVVIFVLMNNIVNSYKDGTNDNFLRDYTSEVVTLTRDVVQGEKITYDMLTTTRIHKNTAATNAITSPGSIVGQIAKYNIAQNTTAVSGMFAGKLVGQDTRIQEISSVLLPIDLVEGDYVDIRIMFPSGVEYIVLAQMQVQKIYGNVIWLEMTEEDILLLNSAIVDSYLTEGSKLYAVRYADPTTQIKLGTEEELTKAEDYIKSKIASEITSLGGTPTTEELSKLISKYAIEYRYYIESYNKMTINYQPNDEVMKFMRKNPYIVEKAKERLDSVARTNIESSIELFESDSGEAYEGLIEGIETSIESINEVRTGLLEG
ncbi:MAG: SAF domain-containing protein [Clostridia bacterium]|nr:SAF domain-containing protein [Clostridia bacterium]